MAQQQGLPKSAQAVNLRAIQNLNGYVDATIAWAKQQGRYPFSSSVFKIEFVMSFSGTNYNNTNINTTTNNPAKAPLTSRRTVELQVPSASLETDQIVPHVQRQVVKLLRMADLSVPNTTLYEPEDTTATTTSNTGPTEITDDWWGEQVLRSDGHYKTAWERSRERVLSRLARNWDRFDGLYRDALRDAQASHMTRGLIRNHAGRRRQFLARILSRISFPDDQVLPLERLVAYRRLYGLLEQQFDYLQLEEFGHYWETLSIQVTSARTYSTSSSALRKRRQRRMETGYSFTIHHDDSVTIVIPVDFQNDELVEELHRNLADFYEWTTQDLGFEELLWDEDHPSTTKSSREEAP